LNDEGVKAQQADGLAGIQAGKNASMTIKGKRQAKAHRHLIVYLEKMTTNER